VNKTTTYTVKFPETNSCLNVGKCCLQAAMKSYGAHYEAKPHRSEETAECEWCCLAINPETDEEFEL
jgi:hypothetical protein